MSRTEMYPWSQLTEIGDYFIVPEELKPFAYISMMVSQRNYRMQGTRLATAKTSLGTMVMLVGMAGVEPPYDTVNDYGIFVKKMGNAAQFSAAPGPGSFERGREIVRRKLTQVELIAQMTPEEREANLPWWHDPKTNKPLIGPRISSKDADLYIRQRKKIPGPDVPYPDYYNLDERLRRRPEVQEDEDEEEDWGEPPIITKYVDPDTGEVVEDAESE